MSTNRPLITRWDIIVSRGHRHDNYKIADYARRLLEFMETAEVGDKLFFVPQHKEDPDYTFSFVGNVYGRNGFEDGDKILTSYVRYIACVSRSDLSNLFAIQTKNTMYYLRKEDSLSILRMKAEK